MTSLRFKMSWVSLLVLIITFGSVHRGYALDVRTAFSHPDAPGAGQVKALTVYKGIFVVLLEGDVLKFHVPDGGSGTWIALRSQDVMAGPEDLAGISILGYDCADVFGAGDNDSQEDVLRKHVGSLCEFLWDYRGGGSDLRREAEGGGLEALRKEYADVLGTLVAPEEKLTGLKVTTDDDGSLLLIVATSSAVYSIPVGGGAVPPSTQTLNRAPEFLAPFSASCQQGAGAVELLVTAKDPDGDTVRIAQTNKQKGYTGKAIVHDCSAPGTFRWSFAAADGRTDANDVPTQEYTITVEAGRNAPPAWSNFSVTGVPNEPIKVPPATDKDGDPLAYGGSVPHVLIKPNGTVVPEAGWCGKTKGTARVTDGKVTTTVEGTVTIPCPDVPASDYSLSVIPGEIRTTTDRFAAQITDILDRDGSSAARIVIKKGGAPVASGTTAASYQGPFVKGEVYVVEGNVDGRIKELKKTVANSPPYDPVKGAWPTVVAEKSAIEIMADEGVKERDPDRPDDGPPCPAAGKCIQYLWGGNIPKGLAPAPEDSSILRGTVTTDCVTGTVPAASIEKSFWVQKRDRDGAVSNKVSHVIKVMNSHAPF